MVSVKSRFTLAKSITTAAINLATSVTSMKKPNITFVRKDEKWKSGIAFIPNKSMLACLGETKLSMRFVSLQVRN